MKKIVLFTAAFVITVSAMAQLDVKKQPATQKANVTKVKPTAAQTAPVQAAAASTVGQPSPDDVIKINTIKYDFGKIKQGTPVTYAFEIKNTSSKPVVVENTSTSCGCTTPEKIVEPIAPGATAKLKVQYNAASVGSFTKDIHIKLAGIGQDKVVQITGEVIAAEAPKPAN